MTPYPRFCPAPALRPLLRMAAFLGVCAASLLPSAGVRADTLLVSAASSLTEAFTAIAAPFQRTHPGVRVQFNFAASGVLERQIEQGAPVDVFAAAAGKEMDALEGKSLLAPGSRIVFAGNRLALVVPVKSRIRGWRDLSAASVTRVAISDPGFVPSGRYARAALQHMGLWAAVEPRAVMGANVRQTLAYVASGDAEAGIVFATDAAVMAGRVRAAAFARSGVDHPPIVYPAAALAGPHSAMARQFVQFLLSPKARQILRRHGFTLPPGGGARR